MKLITKYGELPLPEDLEIEIEQHNPAFSDEGTSSLPITIPATPQALSVLKHPTRIASTARLKKVAATLSEGVYHKSGQLVIASASPIDGISCSFLTGESKFYTEFKEKNLQEIFADKTAYSGSPASVYNILLSTMKGNRQADFTVCPVAVDMDSENGTYKVNNAPDGNGGIEYKSRYIPEGDQSVLVPDGYGLAPFLYLYRMVELLFELNGYGVRFNAFREDAALKKIIVLHNVSDAVCIGAVKYSDLVPDMSVSDFLEWLHDKFLAAVLIDPDTNAVSIFLLQDVLDSTAFDLDLTGRFDGGVSVSPGEPKRVVINADTSLEGAAAPCATLTEFAQTNPIVSPADEVRMNSESELSRYMMVKRLSTGDYYSIGASIDYNNPILMSSMRLGSSYFKYDRGGDMEAEEFSPSDPLPPMVYVDGILMPYIGQRSHRHTQINGKEEKDSGQKIILAYDSGFRNAKGYRLATTQKYDEEGIKWTTYSLTPEDIYLRFFSLYNGLIQGGRTDVSGDMKLQPVELLGFDIMKPKRYEGQLLLCTSFAYSLLHNRIRQGNSSFVLLNNTSDPDTAPVFQQQRYYWRINTSEISRIEKELNEQYVNVAAKADYTIPAGIIRPSYTPTEEVNRAFLQTIPIKYTIISIVSVGSGGSFTVTHDTDIWFDAVKI